MLTRFASQDVVGLLRYKIDNGAAISAQLSDLTDDGRRLPHRSAHVGEKLGRGEEGIAVASRFGAALLVTMASM